MLLPPGPAPSNGLKRGRVDEPCDAQRGHHRGAKRQKREQTPPAFWNNISRVPLCRRALREFERRSKDTTPPERPQRTELRADLKKKLQKFARHGGPDCQDIIAVSYGVKLGDDSELMRDRSILRSANRPTTLPR